MARPALNISSQKSGSRREEIIDVACQTLVRQGLDFSLQDIADQLGTTYNALYHHFKSREDLLLHCFLRTIDRIQELLLTIDPEAPGLDQVMGFLDVWNRSSRDEQNPPARYVAGMTREAQRLLAKRSASIPAGITAMVERGQRDGSIVAGAPLALSTWVLHFVLYWPADTLPARQRGALADDAIALIRRGLAAT